MKKKIFILSLILVIAVSITGCGKKEKNKDALAFKEEYEALNGKTNKSGKEHRTINISEDNPYVKVKPSEIVKMIEDKETFFLYVGDPLCPWCRSVLEKSIEVAKDYKVNKIYYIDIWNDEGNEILRDKFEISNNELMKTVEGTEEYQKLLEEFDSVLSEYSITTEDGEKISTGEKRIYAPNYFFIKNGKVKKLIEGYSSLQTDSREELTKEMLEDEEEQFKELFKLNPSCSKDGC
ncbi:MAG: hypothetical protein IKQ35_06215 [Bacilli bacterium]|nr:hypothetical protein [Bacilli bacterium]